MTPAPRTRSGRLITDELIEQAASRFERGWAVAAQRSRDEGLTVSALVRELLEQYAAR